jgi:hypothetical protein
MPWEFGPRILSVVEVPDFVRFLTTSKTDFTRRNWRELQRLYSPIREEFRAWLRELGVEPQMAADAEEARRIERELKRILDDVPELSEFFGFRARKSVLVETSAGQTTAAYEEGVEATFPVGEGVGSKEAGPLEPGDSPGQALVERGDGGDTRAKPISRVGRRGPGIGFSDAPDRLDLAWIEGSNVIINTGHPCYRRTQSAPLARRMHSLFAIAAAVQRFLAADATSRPDLMFTDRMMAAWGKT